MRLWTKVWIAIAAVCIAVTIYEIPNARLIWRYARAVDGDKQQLKDKAVLESILTEEITAADPEAANILTYCLTESNVEDLADMVAKYPDNEFFLAQLAYKLTDVNLVDARAALTLVDRLIALSPDNAHYRFMKGWMLLKPPWGVGREQDALEQFKLGNDLPDFTLPYSNYKQRADMLCDKARIGPLDKRRAEPSETGLYWDLSRFISRARGTYPKLNQESFRSISAEVTKAASRLIEHAPAYGNLEAGCLLLLSTEGARLRELDLSEAEAQQVRFRLSRAIEISNVLQRCFNEMFAAVLDLMKIALVVAVATVFFLPLPFPFVWVFVTVVNWLRGRAKNVAVGVKAYILFVIGLVGFFGLAVLLGLLSRVLPRRFLAGIVFTGVAIIIWIVLLLLARIQPVDHARFRRARQWAALVFTVLWTLGIIADIIVCALVLDTSSVTKWLVFTGGLLGWSLLCVVVWCTVAYRRNVFRAIPYDRVLRNRFVQLVLVLLLMTGVTGLLRSVPIVPWILVFFTILLVGLVATHVSGSRLICLDAIRCFFCKDGQIVVTRTKMARMMSTILLFCWVTILIGVHLSADKWSRLYTPLTDPLSLYRPLPEATRETYERVLSEKYSPETYKPPRVQEENADLPEHLNLASPEDLSAIISQRQAAGKPISARRLCSLLARGGRDIRPIVLKALNDQDDWDVLIMRARFKDTTAKEQLERIFEEKMALLADIVAPIRKDPDSIESLIIRSRWGDETVTKKLEQVLEAKMVELSDHVRDTENKSELRSELMMLLEMDSALPGSGPLTTDEYEYELMMEQESGLLSPFAVRDPNALNELRKGRDRSSRVRQLIIDANMPELLESGPQADEAGPQLLTSLVEMAGALAFISDPQEAVARFSRLLDLVTERRQDGDSPDSQWSASVLLEAWVPPANLWDENRTCLFYRALAGVPKPNVTGLLKGFLQRRHLADPFDEVEFIDVFERAGDRELTEWVFQEVADSPPTVEVSHFPDGIPIGRPINIYEVKREKRREDIGYRYLEAAFPHLSTESIPLLLGHLDSDNDQLRAFIVWRVTSLGYEWPDEQLAALQKDSYWKVRLNALFACDVDDSAAALDDQSSVVRIIAQMLTQAQVR